MSKLEICYAETSISLYQPNDVYSQSITILAVGYLNKLLVVHVLFIRLKENGRVSQLL